GRLALSGALLGLAVDARLPVLAAAPAFLLAARGASSGESARRMGWWLGGLVVGVAPTLVFVALDADAFLFGNVGFHAACNFSGSLVGDWRQKAEILLELLNIRSFGGETITFQVPLLLALNAYFVALVVRRRAPPTLALAVSVLLSAGLMLPTPTYSQYFVLV